MDLHGAVGDAAHRHGGEQLAARSLEGDVLAVVVAGGCVHDHGAGGIGFHAGIGQHGLDQLEMGDGLAELLALAGIVQRLLHQPFGDADAQGGDVDAATLQHLHGGLEALTGHAADDGRGRHPAVVEDDVGGVRALLPHLAVGLADVEACLLYTSRRG